MTKLKKYFFIFLIALILNLIWENLHSFLYIHYKNQPITELILLRAAIFDAFFITSIGILFLHISFFEKRVWLALIIGVIFSVLLEKYALATNRWAYNELMPIIPIIKTGLSPTLQLGILSCFTYKIVKL